MAFIKYDVEVPLTDVLLAVIFREPVDRARRHAATSYLRNVMHQYPVRTQELAVEVRRALVEGMAGPMPNVDRVFELCEAYLCACGVFAGPGTLAPAFVTRILSNLDVAYERGTVRRAGVNRGR